jgi:hypothetical protein
MSEMRDQTSLLRRGSRGRASLSALTRVFDALWTRVSALKAHPGSGLQPGNIPWPGVSTFFGSNLVFAACTAGQTGP